MTRIAINGIGRIGKLVLRALVDEGLDGEIVLLNDPVGSLETHALLLEFDTIHDRWDAGIAPGDGTIRIDEHKMRFTQAWSPAELPLRDLGIDLVIECTGAHKTTEKLQPYFDAGVKKIVVSAPVKEDEAANIVYGVNHASFHPQRHRIVTAASCTTNCIAPVVRVILEELGIRHCSFTTVHDVTNTQIIADRAHKDPRRARSALNSLIPTTTGSAKAIVDIFPGLEGRINGHAIRVPVLNASLTDMVFEVERETTAAEVNALFDAASKGSLRGILGYETRPLVSADYLNDPRSSIVDAPMTMVTNGSQVKVFAWYDNEWGYAWRLADIVRMVAAGL